MILRNFSFHYLFFWIFVIWSNRAPPTQVMVSSLATSTSQSTIGSIHLHGVIPVLHNLEKVHAPMIAAIMHNRPSISVSLRHPAAVDALASLKQEIQHRNSQCWIGASSVVSEKQIQDLSKISTNFISTMFYSQSIIRSAHSLGIPVLSGTQSFEDGAAALRAKSEALKFFPSSKVTPQRLSELIAALTSSDLLSSNGKIPVIIAGGVKEDILPEYFRHGATGVAVGIDCRALAADSIGDILSRFDLIANAHSN